MLKIDKSQLQLMIDHALERYPYECCGIIAGEGAFARQIIPVRSDIVSSSKYSMNNNELKNVLYKLDEVSLDMIAVYHSHPIAHAYPSDADIAKAVFREIDYIIISLLDRQAPVVKCFKIIDGNVTAVELVVHS